MATKKEHTGFRNGQLFCFNCGQSYDMKLPQPVNMAAAMMKQFSKDHKNCPKTWEEPKPETDGKTEYENAQWWLQNGERGISSETMFTHLSGTHNLRAGRGECHPSDPDDFRRCHLLLEAVPQWRDKLHKMKNASTVWTNLVDNWDKLTEMLLEQMKTRKDNGMYDLMKSLGC